MNVNSKIPVAQSACFVHMVALVIMYVKRVLRMHIYFQTSLWQIVKSICQTINIYLYLKLENIKNNYVIA